MNYNAENWAKLMAPLSETVTATRNTLSSTNSNSQAMRELNGQFNELGVRMNRIESTLSGILKHLGLPETAAPANSSKDGTSSNAASVPTPQKIPISGQRTDRKFQYTSLDTSKSQFRILKVRRAEGLSDPLIAELLIVGLDDDTVKRLMYGFVALSYTWGPPVFEGLVVLDGCNFPITRSLEAALKHLRFSYKDNAAMVISGQSWGQECYIWVDQICINQSDLDERADQVSLMRRIYKRASSVQVWLGEEADESGLAINLLTTLGAPPKHAPGEKTIAYPNFREEDIARHWNALRMFFKRPWWERVWIRQEIALHGVVKLWCGSKSFDMNSLAPSLFMLAHVSSMGYTNTVSHSDNDLEVSLPWDHHPRMLTELRILSGNGRSWVGLAQLLRMTRACKATDARDTVFSVLGLANPEIYQIVPDYRQELKDVMFAAVQGVLKQEHGLDILGACQRVEQRLGMPSWIPGLTEKWKAMPFKTLDRRGQRLIPHLTSAKLPRAQIDGNSLLLVGGIVDTIETICSSRLENGADAEAIQKTYASWRMFAIDAANGEHLRGQDMTSFVLQPELSTRAWIRFLTVLDDDGDDKDPVASPGPGSISAKDPDAILKDRLRNPHFHLNLNPRLSRCHLLPPTHQDIRPHPNQRFHKGLQAYGVGRHIATTSSKRLALVPAEARVGDRIALFEGASFPYVLKKVGNREDWILVGEAYMPSWNPSQRHVPLWDGYAEDLLGQAGYGDLKTWIRLV